MQLGSSDESGAVTEQTEAQKKLAAFVKSKVEEIRASANRVSTEGNVMTNCAYLLGYDGVTFDTQSRSFRPIAHAGVALKKNRIHVNKILPTIQNRTARLCKNQPRYDVRPESNDSEDKEAARLGIQIIGAQWDKLKLNEKRIGLTMWLQQAGHSYVKVGWDPTLGEPMVDPETKSQGDYEGDVRADVASFFEIFPDPMAKTFDDVLQSHLTQAKVRKLDYFKTHYPEYGHLVKEEEAWLLSTQYESRLNALSTKSGGAASPQESLKNSAIELIRYEARSKDYPNGRMIIAANGIFLEDKELPFGEIPFAKFDDIIVGGKYNSEALITHLRPLQDSYNMTERNIDAWVKRFLHGKYKAARGSGLKQEQMTDGESEIVYYDTVPNAPNGPEPVPVPPLPAWAFERKESIDNDFNRISGEQDLDRGDISDGGASIPAIGMQLLTEKSDTRIGIMTEQHEHAWARVGMLILKCVQANYKMPRKLKIAGRALSYTIKEITGDMIRNNTDVYVIRGSTQPGSKTLRNQDILNRMDRGLLGDPKDPKVIERVNEMTEFGDTSEIWQDYGLDMNQIRRGMEKLEQGETIEVHEMDNHALWIQEINRYRKGDKFDALAPEVQTLFIDNVEEHLAFLMKQSGANPPPPPAMPPLDTMDPGPQLPPTDPGAAPPPEPQPPAPEGALS